MAERNGNVLAFFNLYMTVRRKAIMGKSLQNFKFSLSIYFSFSKNLGYKTHCNFLPFFVVVFGVCVFFFFL